MRKLAVLTASFAVGIFLAQYLLPSDWMLPVAVGCFTAGGMGLVLRGRGYKRIFLAGMGLALAIGYNWLYAAWVQGPMEALAGTERGGVVMTVCDYAVSTNFGAKATVKLEGLPFGKAVFYGDSSLLELEPGQTVVSDVRFQSAARIRDDDVTSFTSKGIFLLAYGTGEATYGDGTKGSLRWLPDRSCRVIQTQITELFDSETAGFLTAILTGDKSGLSEGAAVDLSEAGIYHLMAVSGMHCAFLLMPIRMIAGKHRRRTLAAIAIPLLAFYALLTGASPSVVRASVMLVFPLLAPLFQRDSDSPTALSVALALILAANPFAAKSISLQLSFGAVAGLLWLTPKLQRALLGGKPRGRVVRFVVTSVSATMGALVFTVPLSAYYFGTLVLVSPLSNLLCLWIAGFVFVFGFGAVLVSLFCPPIAGIIGMVARLGVEYVLAAAHLVTSIPYHALYFNNPYLKIWLAFGYLLFAVVYWSRVKRRRPYILAGVLAAVTLVGTVRLGQLRYAGNLLDILALDVGQGASTLLASDGVSALIDCGSANSWYSPGGEAADQLYTMGCRKLDYLILTHYDTDHVNGVAELLARIPVEHLLVPDVQDDTNQRHTVLAAAEASGTCVAFVEDVSVLPLGAASLTVFPPVGVGEDNEQGLSILCTAGDYDVLVTGDMEQSTERMLLDLYDLPDIETLMVGHHGSKYATSQELLDALKPETAIISVGSNSYGHPTEEVLLRLEEAGAAVYRTDEDGTVHISLN